MFGEVNERELAKNWIKLKPTTKQWMHTGPECAYSCAFVREAVLCVSACGCVWNRVASIEKSKVKNVHQSASLWMCGTHTHVWRCLNPVWLPLIFATRFSRLQSISLPNGFSHQCVHIETIQLWVCWWKCWVCERWQCTVTCENTKSSLSKRAFSFRLLPVIVGCECRDTVVLWMEWVWVRKGKNSTYICVKQIIWAPHNTRNIVIIIFIDSLDFHLFQMFVVLFITTIVRMIVNIIIVIIIRLLVDSVFDNWRLLAIPATTVPTTARIWMMRWGTVLVMLAFIIGPMQQCKLATTIAILCTSRAIETAI